MKNKMNETNKVLQILLLIIPIVIGASISDSATKICPETQACNSKECNQVSKQLLENLDQETNPCDNFYQFACGGYMKSKNIPDDKTEISTFNDINNLVINKLHDIIKEPVKEDQPLIFKLTKQLYNVCMNTTAVETNNLTTAKNMLKKLGGWPVIEGDSWNEDEFDWKKQMYKFREYGFDADRILGISVESNVQNSSQRIVILDQPELSVDRIILMDGLDNQIVKAYYDYIVDLAVLFGANKDVASIQIKESMEFLYNLGKISLPLEERRNISALTNIMTIAELSQKFPHMNWIDFINNAIAIPGIRVYENDTVHVSSPTFINNLELLLQKTSKRTQANYLMSVVVASVANTLTENIRNRGFQLMQMMTGTKAIPPRWNECLDLVTSKLKLATGAIYARMFFKASTKLDVESLVSDLRIKLQKMLKEVEWMDEETKKEALEKAYLVEPNVGYPLELMNDTSINKFYAPLKLSDDYLDFVVNIQKFETDRKFKRLREPVERNYWVDNSGTHEVNAFYNIAENTIILPAAILQSILFNSERPQAMNYGAIGSIIGHELTHGFDDIGKQINKYGQLQNWWSENTAIEYVNKAKCIINQYSSFTSAKLNLTLNGIITQGENIADNGGVKIAYETYQSWLKQYGNDKCLPSVNYTSNQLFWIALANTWCSSEREEQLMIEMLTSDHPPSYFRVLGILSNSKYFSEDFKCPLGSPMNPINKCTFW